jgi:TPR repeat protein
MRLLMICFALALAGGADAAVHSVAPPVDRSDPNRPPPAADAHCTTCDGVHLMEQGQYGRAMHIFKVRAAAGDAQAMGLLGYMHQHGMGVPVDYDQAMRFYHQAIVAGGDSLAMEQIGFMLQHGLGGPPNPKEAWCWYVWADANGQPNAQKHLAELAVAGQPPVDDCSVLNQWPMKAAARGAPPREAFERFP